MPRSADPTRARRRWFLRPLWRDPAFLFSFVLSALLYGLMLPAIWGRATAFWQQVAVVLYFPVLWLLIAGIVAIPIRTIRGFWQGQAAVDERDRDPEQRRTAGQNAIRVTGRLVGRRAARKRPN